jgi:hypothetical protein
MDYEADFSSKSKKNPNNKGYSNDRTSLFPPRSELFNQSYRVLSGEG